MSKYKQYLYYGIFPSFLTIGLLISYYQYELYQIKENMVYLFYGFAYLLFVLLSVKWIIHKKRLIYYTGYRLLHIVEWSSVYYTTVVLLIYSANYWYSDFVETVSKSVILGSSLVILVICNYFIRKDKYQVVFLKIGDQRYLDLLYFKVYTEEHLQEFDVIPILEEIRDLDLFLFFTEKYIKEEPNEQIKVAIEKSDTHIEITVLDLNSGKEYFNSYILNKEEYENETIMQIVQRLY